MIIVSQRARQDENLSPPKKSPFWPDRESPSVVVEFLKLSLSATVEVLFKPCFQGMPVIRTSRSPLSRRFTAIIGFFAIVHLCSAMLQAGEIDRNGV